MKDVVVDPLSDHWLTDQVLAFSATLLGDGDLAGSEYLYNACVELLLEQGSALYGGSLSDSTLRLLVTINDSVYDEEYLEKNDLPVLLNAASEIRQMVDEARRQLNDRDNVSAKKMNRMLISHAVYLLKRRDLSAKQFFIWLSRAADGVVPGLQPVCHIFDDEKFELCGRIEAALSESRDTYRQTRHRLDQIDKLYDLVLIASGERRGDLAAWWTRICMAYRSSLFCWPLLARTQEQGENSRQGTSDHDEEGEPIGAGISLPISLFLVEDGGSSFFPTRPNKHGQNVWFKYKLSSDEENRGEREPRFQAGGGEDPSHMEGYHFGFTREWGDAFRIGVDIAKKLWSTQNGRLRYADEAAAGAKLHSSLNVDLRAASDIVNAVYSRVKNSEWDGVTVDGSQARFFTVGDRSAEAYWVQCVLGLLLPAREVPIGLCTGQVSYSQGEYEIQDIAGVVAKLEYANRAGVPRVVVPGDRREFYDDSEPEGIRVDVKEFLDRIEEDGARKTLEVNFARTARAAADAMQPAGWRRANFLRTVEFQRSFGHHQRRLFLKDALNDQKLRQCIKPEEKAWYNNRRRWFDVETRQLESIDQRLLTDGGRSVKYVPGAALAGRVPGLTVEETMAKWAAWKDSQIRNGEDQNGERTGYRGPGLGVLTLRTAEGDHEVRLWAALSELLDASVNWWDDFHWSSLPQAAEKLAELLANQGAEPSVSEGSAPDLIIIFDDAGLTQRRSNVVFPTDYHHQFFDLLNPRHHDNNKEDYLDRALKGRPVGPFGHSSRIIIVYDTDGVEPQTKDVAIDADQRALLERLAVFRFGCSRQAAFAMANYGRETKESLGWKQFEIAIDELIQARLLITSRNTLFVPNDARRRLGVNSLDEDPAAHQRAAEALCPILNPRVVRIAGNRDRQLEPENVLEASWHLQHAYNLIPNRFYIGSQRNHIGTLQSLLTYLRPAPDWDTVKKLRTNEKTREQSAQLGEELLAREKLRTGNDPHPSRIGLHIETLGRCFKFDHRQRSSSEVIARNAARVRMLVEGAVGTVDGDGPIGVERRRILRHLYSREAYALRMLGLPFSDERIKGSMNYLRGSVSEILQQDWLKQAEDRPERLNDYPISHDFWRCLWNDGARKDHPNQELALSERSTFAFAAAKSNTARSHNGERVEQPWDEAWLAYFKLTRLENVSPAQIVGPLMTWSQLYGVSDEQTSGFGKRVLNLQPHARPQGKNGRWVEKHGRDIVEACTNVWSYIAPSQPESRLTGAPVGPALRLIRSLTVPETVLAFNFLRRCGTEWIAEWPKIATAANTRSWPVPAHGAYGPVEDEWRSLASSIVGHDAGWIAMLGSLNDLGSDRDRVGLVSSWLHAANRLDIQAMHHADPEELLQKARGLKTVSDIRNTAKQAIANADEVLRLRNDGKWSIYGKYRNCLIRVQDSLKY